MSKSPKVLVVILNWNGTRDTIACLESLRHVEYDNADVLVIDNGSVPGSADPIKEQFPEVTMIRNEKNLGYSGGNNVGLQYARKIGAEYALLLNNDTTVDQVFITELLKVAETDDTIAAVGPKVLLAERPDRIWAVYGAVAFNQLLVRVWGYNRPKEDFTVQKDVEFVIGCGLLVSMKVLDNIGGFDENFFAYHDEVDWCKRARDSGYRIVYVPTALMWHKGCTSTGGYRDYYNARRYLIARNSVLYAKKHATRSEWIRFLGHLVITLPLGLVFRTVTGNLPGFILRLRGLYDGFRGKNPPLKELGLV